MNSCFPKQYSHKSILKKPWFRASCFRVLTLFQQRFCRTKLTEHFRIVQWWPAGCLSGRRPSKILPPAYKDCRVSFQVLPHKDCRVLLLQHLSWLVEKHNIPTVFRSFVKDFLIMCRVVRLSIVFLDVNRTTPWLRPLSFYPEYMSRKWQAARISPSLKSFLELLPSIPCGLKTDTSVRFAPTGRNAHFHDDDTFLRSSCSWTWNAARQTTQVYGSTTRALCKGLEFFTVCNFDGALRAVQFKHDNLHGTAGVHIIEAVGTGTVQYQAYHSPSIPAMVPKCGTLTFRDLHYAYGSSMLVHQD